MSIRQLLIAIVLAISTFPQHVSANDQKICVEGCPEKLDKKPMKWFFGDKSLNLELV